jgi:hippurate hydrolase
VKLQLTVRSYTPEMRDYLLAAIARIAKGEAIATGVPEDRMPLVTQSGDDYTPAALNTEPLTTRIVARFREHFGDARVRAVPPTMAGEDFARYRIADPAHVQSLLFWVGGVPQAQWDAAGGDAQKLPSLHSSLWAPDPEPTIAAAVEAMTTAALDLLRTDINRTN